MDDYRQYHVSQSDFTSSLYNADLNVVGEEQWNSFVDEIIQWPQEAAEKSCQENPRNVIGQRSRSSTNDTSSMFGQWLRDPWRAHDSSTSNDDLAPEEPEGDTNVSVSKQQLDQLRATLSAVVESGPMGLKNTFASHGDLQALASRARQGHNLCVDNHEVLSFDNSGTRSPSVASGFSTPQESFEYRDDSPIYSRRTSASSITSLPRTRGQRIPNGYACARCSAKFDLPSTLRHHERKHKSKEQRAHGCVECGSRFLYPKDLARHDRQVHKSLQCGVSTHIDMCGVVNASNGESQQGSLEDHRQAPDSPARYPGPTRARSYSYGGRRLTNDSEPSTSPLALRVALADAIESEDGSSHPSSQPDSVMPSIVTEDVDQMQKNLCPQTGIEAYNTVRVLEEKLKAHGQAIAALTQQRDSYATIVQQNAILFDLERNARQTRLCQFRPNATAVACARDFLEHFVWLFDRSHPGPEPRKAGLALALDELRSGLDELVIAKPGG